MYTGFLDLPWWGYIVYTLVVTHITIAGVTIGTEFAQKRLHFLVPLGLLSPWCSADFHAVGDLALNQP